MIRALLVAGTAFAITAPASAQSMAGMNMPGMAMPMPAAAKISPRKPVAPKKTAAAGKKPQASGTSRKRASWHSGHRASRVVVPMHDMSEMSMSLHGADHPAQSSDGMPDMHMSSGAMPQHDMGAMPGTEHDATSPAQPMAGMTMQTAPSGTDLPAGNAPAPQPPMDHYADRTYGHDAMQHGRRVMMREEGGQIFQQVLLNLAEFQARSGHNGYRWDGEAWLGGDRNRLWLKSEGEGSFHDRVDSAEVQALYGRAIGPYYNLQLGLRYDLAPRPRRAYATIGFEGLAPYNFETEGALFLSSKGDLLGRLEGWYDQRLTQRIVLQPRAELNLSAQNVPEDRYGAGLTDAELGLRLRYEITREFAPYVGLSWERKLGRTADYARARGEDIGGASLVAGVRFWF